MKKNYCSTMLLIGYLFYGQAGNVGITTSSPTEKLDIDGNLRVRNLPQNGSLNSIFTQTNGIASPTKNQPFIAVNTIVADSNGVLGTISGLPSSGNSKCNGTVVSNPVYTTFVSNLSSTRIINGLDFSNFKADDNFDCIYVLKGNSASGTYPDKIYLPQAPNGDPTKIYTFKVYVYTYAFTILPSSVSSVNATLMDSPCGTNSCRYWSFPTITNPSSISTSSSTNGGWNVFKTLNFTWFDGKWHIEFE